MYAGTARRRALGLRIVASALVLGLLSVIIVFVVAPWSPSFGALPEAMFCPATPAAGDSAAPTPPAPAPGDCLRGTMLLRDDGDAGAAGDAHACRIIALCPGDTEADLRVAAVWVSVALDWTAVAPG
jgi:hypothetical protein